MADLVSGLRDSTPSMTATKPWPRSRSAGGKRRIADGRCRHQKGAARKSGAERERLEGEIERAERKLANQGFVAKAPDAVVQTERDKLGRLRAELAAL